MASVKNPGLDKMVKSAGGKDAVFLDSEGTPYLAQVPVDRNLEFAKLQGINVEDEALEKEKSRSGVVFKNVEIQGANEAIVDSSEDSNISEESDISDSKDSDNS